MIALFFTALPVSASIKITPKTVNMVKGEKTKIKINTKKKVKWSSKNKKVETVNKKGIVTAKKRGKTTIYATVNGKKYSRKITVYSVGEFLTKKYKTVGAGEFIMRTEAGTAENGYVPTLYRGESPKGFTTTGSVVIDISGVDMKLPCWIYIDKKLQRKVSGGYRVNADIPISWDTITFKTHTVEVIQYNNDGPKNAPVFYRKAKYRVAQM